MDIKIYVGCLLSMGMHKYNKYENYWKKVLIYANILQKIISENKFKFINHCLHLPIDNKDLGLH